MIEFEPKAAGETIEVAFDFTARLTSLETLEEANVQVQVYSGVDDEPELLIDGAASIDEAVVTQLVTGGVAGVTYILVASVLTSDHQILQQAGYLVVLE